MRVIHRIAMIATGRLNRPKLNGPGTKSLFPRNRAAMGMQYAFGGEVDSCECDA